MKIEAGAKGPPDHLNMGWRAIATAPLGRDLELAVLDSDGFHALVFPCRRVPRGWANAKTRAPVGVHPTHWREWDDSVSPVSCRAAH